MPPDPGPRDEAAAREVPDVVVLSPHLDDAVLSLGGLLARLAGQGRRVQVWTAFTQQSDLTAVPRAWRTFGDYPARLAEDDEALALLGVAGQRLGLPERIWREPRPRTLAGAFRCPPGEAGFACLPALTATVTGLLAHPDVEVYAPLGIGRHVDHVELALAAVRAGLACGSLDRIGFYEDFYALGAASRRGHPVSRRAPDRRLGSPGRAAPGLGAVLWLMAVAARGPRLDDYAPQVRDELWQCERHPVAATHEDMKLAAVNAYRSQVPRLGGRRRLETALRRSHRVRGGELVWRAAPSATAGDEARSGRGPA